MDRYLPTPKQKNGHDFTSFGPVVCILGKPGIGKTWTVVNTLGKFIELTYEILKSKKDTVEFLEKIQGTGLPVLLDEYECVCELVGIREIKGPPTNGLFVIVSQVPVKFDFDVHVYDFPVKSPEEIRKIFPDADPRVVAKCHGDLRIVLQSLKFQSDERDEFFSPREFITSLVSKRSNVNPAHYIGEPIQEPGNIASLIQSNYPDSSGNLVDDK
jgi:hypothetical protein